MESITRDNEWDEAAKGEAFIHIWESEYFYIFYFFFRHWLGANLHVVRINSGYCHFLEALSGEK